MTSGRNQDMGWGVRAASGVTRGSGGAWLLISAQLKGSRCLTKWISGDTEFSAVSTQRETLGMGASLGCSGH